jgi:membrane protein implicated in regulation of membrane protease activity
MAETVPSAPPPAPAARLPLITPTRVVCGVLLAAPFVALLWVNSYARLTPSFIGIPFFYWYQLLWVVLSALLTGCVYLLIRREESRRRARPGSAPASGSPSGEVGR